MFDFAMPNEKPGQCNKCNGTGVYRWGHNGSTGKPHSGSCHSCRGSGVQTPRQIRRNHAYNRHKARMVTG